MTGGIGGTGIDLKDLIDLGKTNPELLKSILTKAFQWLVAKFTAKPTLPKNLPAAHEDVLDEDIPDPKAPQVNAGVIDRVTLSEDDDYPILRAVKSAKRFPQDDANGTLSYIPAKGTNIPFGSKVTFQLGLVDAAGVGIKWGKGSALAHKNEFYLRGPNGDLAQVGPGSGDGLVLRGTADIGPGGKNYDDSQGAVATFRCASEGNYEFFGRNSGKQSKTYTFTVS